MLWKEEQTTGSGIPKEKMQIVSTAIFRAYFAMVCMGENRADGFLSHAFTTVYNCKFEREKQFFQAYKMI